MARSKAFDVERAVDSAVDCFWRQGYEAASVRDLAGAMGIGGTSLYNAFGDKRALFARALERYANRSMRERVARLEAGHGPKAAIVAFIEEIVRRSVADPDRKGCLLVNSALDVAPRHKVLARKVSGYLGEIEAFFRRNLLAARQAGEVPRRLDVDATAKHLLGVVAGIRVLARTGASRRTLQAVASPALALLEVKQ